MVFKNEIILTANKIACLIKKQGLLIQFFRAQVVAVYACEIFFSSQNSPIIPIRIEEKKTTS